MYYYLVLAGFSFPGLVWVRRIRFCVLVFRTALQFIISSRNSSKKAVRALKSAGIYEASLVEQLGTMRGLVTVLKPIVSDSTGPGANQVSIFISNKKLMDDRMPNTMIRLSLTRWVIFYERQYLYRSIRCRAGNKIRTSRSRCPLIATLWSWLGHFCNYRIL